MFGCDRPAAARASRSNRCPSAAGLPAGRVLVPGTAVAISTGAVVPEGADAVVPVERSEARSGSVEVEAVAPGENVRPRGGDARADEILAAAGTRVGPALVG